MRYRTAEVGEEEIIQSFENYWHDNDETVLPPMFHGTDISGSINTKEIHFFLRVFSENGICIDERTSQGESLF